MDNGNNAVVGVDGEQSSLNREQIELIKTTVARGCTDDELRLFLYVARRTGLDPLLRQIHAVKRWDRNLRREVMTIQTGIDGYRLTAQRTGQCAGSDDPVYAEQEGSRYPIKAAVTVYRLVAGQPRPYSASARWDEYVQLTKEGQVFPMWDKMPFLMLGKCAEALALRKAFPAELSGIYTHEEMMQASNDLPMPSRVPAATEDGEHVNDDTPDPEVFPAARPAAAQPQPNGTITQKQLERLIITQKEAQVEDEPFKAWLTLHYDIKSRKEIKQKNLDEVMRWLGERAAAREQH